MTKVIYDETEETMMRMRQWITGVIAGGLLIHGAMLSAQEAPILTLETEQNIGPA